MWSVNVEGDEQEVWGMHLNELDSDKSGKRERLHLIKWVPSGTKYKKEKIQLTGSDIEHLKALIEAYEAE